MKGKHPKIIIPIAGVTLYELEKEIETLNKLNFDIVEWRADYFKGGESLKDIALSLRSLLNTDKQLLFTLRTANQGGVEITDTEYVSAYIDIINSGAVDIIDTENTAANSYIIDHALSKSVLSILSHHEFNSAPSKEEINKIARELSAYKSDIIKLAFTAKTAGDTFAILHSGLELESGRYIIVPMGDAGKFGRAVAGFAGSVAVYACHKTQTAQGQLSLAEIQALFNVLYS